MTSVASSFARSASESERTAAGMERTGQAVGETTNRLQRMLDTIGQAVEGFRDIEQANVRIAGFGVAPMLATAGPGVEVAGFQRGGTMRRDGLAMLHRGEPVLRREAGQALGPMILQALNRARPVDVRFGGITIQGGGGASPRDQARALMVEIERAMRRGGGLGGVL
jgi:hypothetical protein